MERLTHERVNGIREGYWSPNKKQELIDRLAAYENTGLDPEKIQDLKERDKSKPPIYQVQGDERYEQEPDWWECPNCEEVYDMDDDYDFCPNCGQRIMR